VGPVHDHRGFALEHLLASKGDTRVSVCIPAHDEAATIGDIVGALHRALVVEAPLIDELLVVDDRSSDDTAEVARQAGARVVNTGSLPGLEGPFGGKGDALWTSLHETTGDVVVWCDADIRGFGLHFVTGLLGPLLTDPAVAFVKGFYERPVDGVVGTGGRTTELVARPLLALLFPELSHIVQPLAGEYGGRREVLEELPFVEDYGVDLALLIDVAAKHGVDAIAQVDLGVRVHRNRSLDELSPQALSILQAVLRRSGADLPDVLATTLVRPGLEPLVVRLRERPPLVQLDSYRLTH
jgi:glucosyl-3-phosphoglycerate synthase